jgi:hypothetical protein
MLRCLCHIVLSVVESDTRSGTAESASDMAALWRTGCGGSDAAGARRFVSITRKMGNCEVMFTACAYVFALATGWLRWFPMDLGRAAINMTLRCMQ